MKTKKYILPFVICAILVAFDQLTKHIVDSTMALYESKPVIKGVFEIAYIRNTGSAWGLFSGKTYLLLIFSIIVLFGILYIYHNILDARRYLPLRILIIFLLAGAIGNMIDRIEYKYVIDFFYIKLINFPVFNVADIFVTFSIALIIILMIFKYNTNDMDVLLGEKILLDDGTYEQKRKKSNTEE